MFENEKINGNIEINSKNVVDKTKTAVDIFKNESDAESVCGKTAYVFGSADVNEEKPEPQEKTVDCTDELSKEERSRKRFFSLLHTIFYICRLAGFKIEGRITMRDLRTGKVWR